MPQVSCHLSPGNCHHFQQPRPGTSPPANSPTMQSRLVCKDKKPGREFLKKLKKHQNWQKNKTSKGLPISEMDSKSNNLWLIDNHMRRDRRTDQQTD